MTDNPNVRFEPESKYGGMRVELGELGGEKRIEIRIWKDDGIKVLSLAQAKQLADWILELMPKLHVFSNDQTDFVIAYDEEDALKVDRANSGCSREDICAGEENPFSQEPDDQILAIVFQDDDELLPNILPQSAKVEVLDKTHRVSATNRAWADLYGRHWLCSTEY
jgi:hypothetical protein